MANQRTWQPAAAPAESLTLRRLLGDSDAEMAFTDPLAMNLVVAREIRGHSHLAVEPYQHTADQWADEVARGLPQAEREFRRTPQDWKGDLNFFRLGYLCWYVDQTLGIRYREDQKYLTGVPYTDPADLFLHGVMDTRRGTCANMAALHVALGWRLNWPVSLACVWSHFVCRYDDGKVRHNIEATKNGRGGFHSHPDKYYMEQHRLPRRAVACGSDLAALSPREMLGTFVGLRARHYSDTGRYRQAEQDYLLARYLFPKNRYLHFCQVMASVQTAAYMFETSERGHPVKLADWLREMVRPSPWGRLLTPTMETTDERTPDAAFTYCAWAKPS
jgi:hypothetical protein